MSVVLRKLIKQVKHMDFKLVAGEQGLDALVRWTHMVDSPTVAEFLEGGEMAFTTGLGLGEEITLLGLVESVYDKGASSMVINIGPYIQHIEQSVLDFANEKDFPLFEVPWEVHMADIMRIFCFQITKAEQTSIATTTAFKNAFFCPKDEAMYVPALMQKGYMPEWSYSIAVMDILTKQGGVDERRLIEIKKHFDIHLQHFYQRVRLESLSRQLVLIFYNYTENMTSSIIYQLFGEINDFVHEGERVYFSVGKVTKSIRCLYKSYQQAVKISEIQQSESQVITLGQGRHQLLFHKEMGVYKLLMSIEDKEVIREYIQDTLYPLIEHDRIDQSDLLPVLKCYIKHSGSVKETAEELFVHRNTINYKIKKAEEILDIDLSSLDERLRLRLGFMLYDLSVGR